MPNILPFNLDPASTGLDRFTGYWFASCCHAAYFATASTKLALYALAGGTNVISVRVPGQSIPEADIAFFPGGRAVVTIQGTRFFLEFLNQVAGAQLVQASPWPGHVGQYWTAVTQALWDEVRPILVENSITSIALAGHSQGGGICQLIPNLASQTPGLGIANLFSIGAPRTGSVLYAEVQGSRYLRLTNAGDPVPSFPPSVSTPLNRFLWLIPPVDTLSFLHWGTRFHLFANGSAAAPAELPSWIEGFSLLADTALNSSGWFNNHFVEQYARRLRLGIPGGIGEANPDYPGLQTLDDYWEDQEIAPPAEDWFQFPMCS